MTNKIAIGNIMQIKNVYSIFICVNEPIADNGGNGNQS